MTEVALNQRPALRTLFLHAPSFDGFDGGAGSRYQAKRKMLGKTMIEGSRNPVGIAILTAALLTPAPAALAVPSFARQTGMACEA